ncbi:MAG: phosphoribosylanthranilate isomerase [Rickettsiales bacterium]
MSIKVKICGLKTTDDIEAITQEGADYAGFVYHHKSPRHIELQEAANLVSKLPDYIKAVIVTVNPDDDLLRKILAMNPLPDFIQLHGNESADRITKIKSILPDVGVIKAISVRDSNDVKRANEFYELVDFLLFDAKPKDNNSLAGGNGISFDWSVMDDDSVRDSIKISWFLSGGLNKDNVREAILRTKAKMIDLSSGVEEKAGVKSASMIKEFMEIVRNES